MKLRTLSSIIGASLIVGFAMGGCGSDDGNSEETTNPPYTPDPNAAPKLLFVASQAQMLQFGQTASLTVRYVDQNKGDTGITGAPIDYVIVGEGGGSKLGATRATTNSTGEANVVLTAGQQNATFQVEVSPPTNGGTPISFQVAVSDQPIGSIGVSMAYLGELPLEKFIPELHKGVTCANVDPEAIPTPLMTTSPPLASIDDTTSFVALNVADNYAVTVTAKVGPTNIRAFGCVDGIAVKQSETTNVKVALADLDWPGPVLGTYDLTNILDFGGTLPSSVQLAVDVIDEFTDDKAPNAGCDLNNQWYGEDPGAFLSDFIMRQTCRWECAPGEDWNTCSGDHPWGDIGAVCLQDMTSWGGGQPRFTGGCGGWEVASSFVQNQINDLVKKNVPGGVLAFAEMAGDLARAINQAKIYSVLNVQEGSDTAQPMTHKLTEMEVLLHNMQGQENIYKFDLAKVGLTSLQTNANLSVDVTYVTIPEHEFKLSYGKLIQYIYLNGLLPLLGFTSTAEMFQSWVNCQTIGVYLEGKIGWMSANQYEQYCNTAITLAGDTFDNQIFNLIKGDGTLKLQGTCTADDIDINNIAHTLADGKWIGQWGEDAGSSGNVSGTFVGKLRD
jgi:hypothetical protein